MTAPIPSPHLAPATRRAARRLIPFLGLLYLVNYLDRTNMSFAGPNGMSKAVNLSSTGFGFAAGIFFLGYLLLEVPSNMILHKVGARRWIARILVTWGIVAGAIAFVNSAGLLYALRFLLGIAEAGFFPGIILYLTFWFPQEQPAKATAWFMAAVPLSSAIGSPLPALIIEHGHGWFGLNGWRVMFLIEAICAVLLGVVCWFFLDDRPATAKWMPQEERDALTRPSLRRMPSAAGPTRSASGSPSPVAACGHWPLSTSASSMACTPWGSSCPRSSRASSPSSTGPTRSCNSVLSPPSRTSSERRSWWHGVTTGDRTRERVWHVAGPVIIGGIAIPITLYLGSTLAAMIAVTICTVGIMCALPTFRALPTNFLAGAASGLAPINSAGNAAGFLGPYITGWLADLTGSKKAGLWAVGFAMVTTGPFAIALKAAPQSKVARQ